MDTITEMFVRGWDNFLARPQGSMNFRFIIQPTLAAILAIRAGLKDAREGRPPFLWALLTKTAHRKEVLRGALKDVQLPFFVAIALDIIYQIITNQRIYPLELLFTATLLAAVPYFIVRGLANRIARLFFHGQRPVGPTDHDPPN
jgi:hypothetical protein